MKIDGACLCGHLSYEADIDPKKVVICHCTQCQVSSASAFRFGVLVGKENFRLLSGQPKVFVKTAENGNQRALAFCPECGTSLYGTGVDVQDVFSLRLGTARQRAELVPTSQIWCRSALPWLSQLEGMRKHERQGARTQPAALHSFHDAANWYGPQMALRCDWFIQLTPSELAELDSVVDSAIARRLDQVTMTEHDFPLPLLAPRLRAVRHDVLHGRGFALLRGWPSTERTMAQSAMAFRGIGAHLGEPVSQNAKGHMLGHVANLGLDYADPSTRGYQTTADLKFHTDGGDMVGLLCIRPSRNGGLSRIASSTTVWNEVVRRRPDLAQVLAEPFCFSRVGEVRPDQQRFFRSPIFQPCEGRMIALLVQSFIQKAQAFDEVPRLTAAQTEALEFVDTLSGDPAIRLDMDFRPGDMQFLCNHSIFHSRTSYEDWPEPERRRHLLRLWLSSPEGPALPPSITNDFQGATASGRPDGIHIPGTPLIAPLEPA